MDDNLFDSQNAAYAQAMFEEYARNPEAVPAEWRTLFEKQGSQAVAEGLFVPDQIDETQAAPMAPAPAYAPAPTSEAAESLRAALPVVSRATALVQAFRDHGHRLARIDPLGSEPPGHPQLTPSYFGTSMEELDELPASLVRDENGEGESVADALRYFGEIYTGTIGYEFEHLDDHVKVDWLWDQVESHSHMPEMSADEKRGLLRKLSNVEGLEQFLHRAYLGQKRFSLEGNDALVPMLDLTIDETARAGGDKVVLGMAHRGRLNVLTHTLGVSYGELLAEFEGPSYKGGQLDIPGTGDVKYHHGARGEREVDGAGTVQIRLAPNPSHLEFVNPVVAGMTRATQFDSSSKDAVRAGERVVPVLMHGDAAFAAEGVVAETLNMSRLHGYDVGGTVHIIVNNQVGFTTDPRDARSTTYSSDLAKGYGIPIVHVNADDAEACLATIRLAMMYRAQFNDDFVIDLVGYRRHGHNEGDEPAYTQPMENAKIASHPTARTIYADRLADEGVVSKDEAEAIQNEVSSTLRDAQDHVREFDPVGDDTPDEEREVPVVPESTGVDFEVLSGINTASLKIPDGFTPHPKLWRQLSRRGQDFSPEKQIDWGHAETLAFGSLLNQNIPIRLTGQDVQRGTFSHRHIVLHDVETGALATPLQSVSDARLEVHNSPLTETAVIGFEYGYSVAADEDVVLWEAQFGDFVNVAQVMIDQFLSSGHMKWGQYSRLTLLLPHGHEGQGPEHSSARLERFLQLCAEQNMRVTYPTTPAQYFHMLRRQALRRPERPMIVMTPKSLLRLPSAASAVSELTEGNFQHVLDDPTVEDADAIERLVLCTGKIYYDIQAHERRPDASNAAVARQELLYPFPTDALKALLARYPNLKHVVWTQEEPRNMGALTFVGPRLRSVVPRTVPLTYVARPERASPAEGKATRHAAQQEELVLEALGLDAQ
ncbi:MAG: 2-oxoglutarate dehydrogenase E1 component [Gemmatimonadales bacterium]|jgi:2-oxoglutarate dehydrogenase E1 component|nr:2-oxoglutarate dehydrogenase E1 component [Gemmatimonadales bacterium]MBT5697058.1 2-oxoglutarate dehydrogenase E1 component [Gemmatimonadales bacterium]MBT7503330.1 2-oxoglutarate dehydrogenase E1 component [Gemmatimonadales bacterium]MBT7694157.1 2-oxoglutarate dehydrogenase E1 component [Gemmatimonadales bacterium]